jgi:hypothetical protein
LLGVLALGVNTAVAQNASSKQTAAVNTMVVCKMSTAETADMDIFIPASCTDIFSGQSVSTNSGGWIEIMSKPLKVPTSNSIFVDVSLVTGLYTKTAVKTRTATAPDTVNTSTAEAMGGVYLRVVAVDSLGNEYVAAPISFCDDVAPAYYGCIDPSQDDDWGVILNSRIQTLTQSLSQCLVQVTDLEENILSGTCDFESTIDLTLNTTSAHSFNFILENLGRKGGSDTYTLKIYAAVASDAAIVEGSGTAIGAAVFGLGSMTAEKVRLVNGFEF